MPLLVRLILERAASILRDLGTSWLVKMSINWDFLAEDG